MHLNVRGWLDAGRHAHRRPPDTVETNDFFANQVMNVGPPLGRHRFVAAVANSRQVVNERVVPNVKDVLFIPRHGNAPAQRAASNRDITQAALDKGHGFVALGIGRGGFGVLAVPLEEAILEGRKPEEPVLLFHLHDGSSVHGTVAIGQSLFGEVVLAGNAVETAVVVLVDVAVVVDRGQKLLHRFVVTGLGRADEVVVGDIEVVPRSAETGRGLVGPGLG